MAITTYDVARKKNCKSKIKNSNGFREIYKSAQTAVIAGVRYFSIDDESLESRREPAK